MTSNPSFQAIDEPQPIGPALLLSLGAALLLVLSFPQARCWPFAFVALVPFELATYRQNWRRALLLGLLFGFVLQSYLMFWANFFGPPAFLFLALYRAYPYALAGWGWATLSRYPLPWRLSGCLACWVFVEFYQTWGPFGATWGMVGHTLARQTSLIQICSLGGPWLVSAALVATNLVIAETWRRRASLGPSLWPAWASIVLIWTLTCGFGWERLRARPSDQPFQVGAVQVNMGRDVKWDPQFAQMAISRLEELSLLAALKSSQLTVWPETSIPYRGFLTSPNLLAGIGKLAEVSRSCLLVGSIEFLNDAANHTTNTAALITPEGHVGGRYDKQRLVPGGEYLPFERWLRPFPIFDRVMRYLPGEGNGVLTCRFATDPRPLRVGVLICFESMVPHLAAQRVKDGAQALAVATNDGWFGESSAITHHFEMAIFRAIETARPVIQSGNTGISGIIDAYGRVLQETLPNEKTFVVGPLVAGEEVTPYVRWGDWVGWMAGVAWGVILIFCRARYDHGGPDGGSPKVSD